MEHAQDSVRMRAGLLPSGGTQSWALGLSFSWSFWSRLSTSQQRGVVEENCSTHGIQEAEIRGSAGQEEARDQTESLWSHPQEPSDAPTVVSLKPVKLTLKINISEAASCLWQLSSLMNTPCCMQEGSQICELPEGGHLCPVVTRASGHQQTKTYSPWPLSMQTNHTHQSLVGDSGSVGQKLFSARSLCAPRETPPRPDAPWPSGRVALCSAPPLHSVTSLPTRPAAASFWSLVWLL